MANLISDQDEFRCGSCGSTSHWRETYYQSSTPDTHNPTLPKPGYLSSSGWDRIEHYRVFCPKCGLLIADTENRQIIWVRGSQPLVSGKLPAEGGGNRIYEMIEAFLPFLVPHGSYKLDLEGYMRACAEREAGEEARKVVSVPELIDRLRASKGTMADDIEWKLASKGEEAVPFLVAALKDPEVYLRWRTCYVLGRMEEKASGARRALKAALRDNAEGVRRGAQEALARIPVNEKTFEQRVKKFFASWWKGRKGVKPYHLP